MSTNASRIVIVVTLTTAIAIVALTELGPAGNNAKGRTNGTRATMETTRHATVNPPPHRRIRSLIRSPEMSPRPAVLSAEDLEQRLASLPEWDLTDGRLHRSFIFVDFTEAFAFMTSVAGVAEELDHHPDWPN